VSVEQSMADRAPTIASYAYALGTSGVNMKLKR